jgi:outer membrane protein assembly factor BamA
VLKRIQSDTTNPSTFVTESRAYGTGTFTQFGYQLSFDLDGRDLMNYPTRGYHVFGGGSFYPETLDVEHTFGEVHGEAAAYLSPSSTNPTLAVRAGGKKVWGTYPYSEAAFLGGIENLRGLREQRYAGDAMVYGSTELRVFLGRILFLFPMDFGVFGLADLGRVFVDGESSDEWYASRGGGIWLAPVKRSATLYFSAAQSGGHWEFNGGMGFGF